MSIYRKPDWMVGRSDVHRFRRQEAGPSSSILSGEAAPAPTDWTPQRRARPAEHLLPSTERWMDSLPRDAFPAALATQFPRIVNLIAIQWNDGHACPAYFEELLVDRRGGRQGFPVAVKADLVRLRAHWYSTRLALR